MHRTVRQLEGYKMSKEWIAVAFGILTLAVFAEPVKMPSKSEINAAKDAVEALISSGTTAEEFLEMAGESESGAERYHAYRCAFIMQAKEGKFEEAAETLKNFQSEVTGVPASEIVSLIDKNVGKKLNEAKELQVVYNDSKVKLTAEKQIVKIKKEIKKNPKDPVLKRSLAEAMAISGDWSAALKEFENAGGEVADIAKVEKKNPTTKIAAFWWDYKPHKSFGTTNAFKLHAANIYAILIEKGGLSKFEAGLAEKRITAVEELGVVVEESQSDDNRASVRRKELTKLKKICEMKGLVHCWRFNGNLYDCIGSSDANINGEVDVGARTAILKGGENGSSNISLGNGVTPQGETMTIEIWAKRLSYIDWARIYSFGPDSDELLWSWNVGPTTDCSIAYANKSGKKHYDYIAPLNLKDHEYHLAAVFESKTDGSTTITYYQQDNQGRTLIAKNTSVQNWQIDQVHEYEGFLGHALLSWVKDANLEYNEVRIWNRALSEKELTQNAIKFHKAGETMKSGVIPAATHSRTTSVQTSSGATSKEVLKPSSSKAQNGSFGTVID